MFKHPNGESRKRLRVFPDDARLHDGPQQRPDRENPRKKLYGHG
jgi:hypothetical protein